LTVFYGPNEVGKSTVTAFIRTMLFGFPRGSKAEGWYPPLSGGNHGGRVEIVDDDSNQYTLERHRVSNRDRFRINGATIRDDSLIKRLRGHLTQKAFEAIFAFNLSDLNGLGDDSDISSRIYSAGTGATQLPKALKELERQQGEIYKKRGRVTEINKVLTELVKLDADLQTAAGQSTEYAAGRRREDKLVALIAETKQKKKEAQIRQAECRRIQGAWKTWLDSRKDDAELSRCSIQDGFPDEPLIRLKMLEDQITQCEEARDGVKRDLSTATTKSNRTINNEALVLESDLSARCKTIDEKRQSYKDWVKDRPTQLAAQKKEQAGATKCLQALGSDWSPERLELLDLSQTTQAEVDSWKEQLDDLKEERRSLRQERDRLERERQDAERTVAHRRILAIGIGIAGVIATIVLWFQDFREWYVPVGLTALLFAGLLQKARTDLRCAKNNTDDFRSRVVKQEGDIVNKTDAWSNWLKKRGFPDTLRVDTYPGFLLVVQKAQSALETLKTTQRRLYGITKDIEEYGDEVKTVATCDAISLDGAQSDVAELADQIISEMKAVEKAQVDRDRNQQDVDTCTNELKIADETGLSVEGEVPP
jgi:hypothetical protein